MQAKERVRKMEIGEFWQVLLWGVAIGLVLGMALRWIGRRLLGGREKEESGAPKEE